MTASSEPTPETVMEIVSFRLHDTVAPADFETAARAIDALLQKRGTATSRTLVRDEDGLWTDIVQWTSMAEAHSAAEELTKDPAFAPMGAMIDPSTIHMRHAPIRHQME